MNPSLINIAKLLHVPLLLVSYFMFAAAFAVGAAYLWQEAQMKSKHPTGLTFQLPSLDSLDHFISKLILVAVPLLTLGILLGGVWAKSAWGRYWGWDPKETWALITWLVYVTYGIVRWGVGWRGRKTTYFSLAGFAVVLFTYMGVNYFSPLHNFLWTVPR